MQQRMLIALLPAFMKTPRQSTRKRAGLDHVAANALDAPASRPHVAGMDICILGAGVVGLTTAWMLAEAGANVTIVDRQTGPGQEASRGNGAQLSYHFVAPLASPDTLRHLPGLLLQRDGPLRVRPGWDPGFLRWGLGFLAACRPSVVRDTVASQLALAALSRAEMEGLAARLPLRFGFRRAGKLVAYRGAGSFAAARRGADADQQVMTPDECLALEPALRLPAAALSGGVYTASEQVGDCGAFCDGLAAQLRARNSVAWHMGATAAPVLRDGRMVAVQAGGVEIGADAFVLALGAGAAAFARQAGLWLPVYPMKGYSLTLRPRIPASALRHSVTDADRKVVFAPLERDGAALIRVAGVADMVGHDRRLDPARLGAVRRAAEDALDVDWTAEQEPWAGLRPATPTSRPIVGWSRVPGLFLNTGHGALGWTLACGTARLTRDALLPV